MDRCSGRRARIPIRLCRFSFGQLSWIHLANMQIEHRQSKSGCRCAEDESKFHAMHTAFACNSMTTPRFDLCHATTQLKLSPVTSDRFIETRSGYRLASGVCLAAGHSQRLSRRRHCPRNPQMNPVLRASTASVLTVVFSFVSTVSGCKSAPAPAPQDQAAAPTQAAPATPPACAHERR